MQLEKASKDDEIWRKCLNDSLEICTYILYIYAMYTSTSRLYSSSTTLITEIKKIALPIPFFKYYTALSILF